MIPAWLHCVWSFGAVFAKLLWRLVLYYADLMVCVIFAVFSDLSSEVYRECCR